MNDLLQWLQTIFKDDLCNGSWEHTHGIVITTLDNPGWDFKFDLRDTDIVDISFKEVLEQKDPDNWFHCRIKEGVFEGWGGPQNLTDIISTFRDWYLIASEIAENRKGN